MEKILENTFRNINIALANEMAILCNRMGISVWEVIEAAKTKPYGFMAFYPGPGLGGHCIPIDPFYLTWKAREYNYHTRLIESAGEIGTLSETVSKIGFTVRGMYGEGSKSAASLYQVSNQVTLGLSEKEAIENLKIITTQLVEKEKNARERLNKIKIEDTVYRALGTLKNCRLLTSSEMMNLISKIKLGLGMGIIKEEINPMKLFVENQPYSLMKKHGNISPDERDIVRASDIREALGGK